MNDQISRTDAIKHLKKRLYETALNSNTEHPYYEEIADNRIDVWMNEVPATASGRDDWIPVNGTPPKNRQRCLLTIETVGGRDRYVDIGTYSTNLYEVNIFDFCNKRGVSGWYWYSSEWGYCEMLNVVAWKPLDEPYMGD